MVGTIAGLHLRSDRSHPRTVMGELSSKELVGGNPIIYCLVTNLPTTKGQTKFLP